MIFNQCIGKIVNRRTARIAGFLLTLAASLALATPSFAQAQAEKADNVTTKKKPGFFLTLAASLALATPSFTQAQAEKADNVTTKKKQRPVSTLGPSAASSTATGPAPSQTSQNSQAVQAQNPLTPLWGVINENYTNFRMGPLEKTQNILVVEPIIPLKLTPDWNLVIRWNTPITAMPRLAEPVPTPVGHIPGIGPEFGLSNMNPQFFFTPAHPGSFDFAVGPALWLPTATDDTLGINEWGGGPVVVGLTIQGPLLIGFLAQNIWAGDQSHGSSATGDRVNSLLIEPFVFYNFPGGWFLTYRPLITADWTVDEDHRWTVPVGGGFGRVFPVGNMVLDIHAQAFYNGLTEPAAGSTNVGEWTALLVVHFLLPGAQGPVSLLTRYRPGIVRVEVDRWLFVMVPSGLRQL